MLIKKIGAKIVRDSRGEKTIKVVVKTKKGKFDTSAPSGKSTGRYEARPYKNSLKDDVEYINNLNVERINELSIENFEDLEWIERFVFNDIGANSLFVLESSLLKALARENGKELWEFLGGKKKDKLKLRPIGNAIGGGLHSKGIKSMKPEFQEFLFIAKGKNFRDSVKINNIAYTMAHIYLKS